MENIVVSLNGLYIITEDNLYSVAEDKTFNLDEVNLSKWIDIFRENTIFSLKNNLVESRDLAFYHRKVTYQILGQYNDLRKYNLMMEYEGKFGNLLLNENVVLLESWFGDAWNWTKDKIAGAGSWVIDKFKEFGSFAVQAGKDLVTCVTSLNCSPLFEDFREMLFSPVGIAVETFLTVSGIGTVGPMIAWGILGIYDAYLLLSGSPDFHWLNLICDILGVGLGSLAKTFRGLFGGAKAATGTLEGVVETGMKNPEAKTILTKIANSKIAQGLKNTFSSAADFLTNKLKLKWVGQALTKISDVIAKFLEKIGIVAKAEGITTSQAVKKSLKQGAIAQGITSLVGGGAAPKIGTQITGQLQLTEPVAGIEF
jgi:hypothetical protein